MAFTTINKSGDYFNTKLYTGTGSNQSLTGVGFQPDLIWWKCRNSAKNHGWTDAVRGNTKIIRSNQTNAESTDSTYIQSFDSDGTTIGSNGNINSNGDTFCLWNWKANGTGSSNTDGSINTTYTSVNTTSGFSISSYTGNGTAGATVGHGLGVTPKMVIVKKRSASGFNWVTQHASIFDSSDTIVALDSTSAAYTQGTANFNGTAAGSSVFTIGGGGNTNDNGATYIAYCFADVQGYSKFGSYLGNGNADGSFIYTGFSPAFVMIKQTTGTGKWVMKDNRRTGINVNQSTIYANESEAEGTPGYELIDLLSNGFKQRGTGSYVNGSGQSYIYMAFAAAPLVGTNNIPANAR